MTNPRQSRSLELPAPAKLNLCLHITGRRPDGYHTLQTAFQLLDFGDSLHFTPRTDEQLTLQPDLPDVAPEQNLILRAARRLQELARHRAPSASLPGIDIRLDKRLPLGGGLGGGSSDAATTLIALNRLWQLGLTREQLQTIGLELGADVPVFVAGQSAWAEGVGERLTPIALPPRWYLVLTPRCQISTAGIFCHKDLTRDTAPITVAAFLERGGQNDCQPLVRKLYPEVDNALIWLEKFSPTAQMSGTGASVFAAFDNEAQARAIFSRTPSRLPGFVARGVNRSPVYQGLPDRTESGSLNR